MWKEMLFCNISPPAICIDSRIELNSFVCGSCVWQVLSFYLKMPRTKKFALKPKFRVNKYVRVNKVTGVSEKTQPRSYQSGTSTCVKHNLSASNKKIHGISVNTEINVDENSFCKSESDFTQDGNIVVSINLLCAFIEKKH
jgi:hypothetical protein